MYDQLEQSVSAGEQFDGTPGKGRFEWPGDRSGVTVTRIDLVLGAENKNWEVVIANNNGAVSELEKGSGVTQFITLLYEISIKYGERIEIRTSGATSAMKAFVTFRDESLRWDR